MWTPKWTPKLGVNGKKRVFNRINLSNMQKNRAFIRSFRINPRFWCGRQELKTYDDTKKALIFKAFLLLNANMDAKVFWGRYDIAGLI